MASRAAIDKRLMPVKFCDAPQKLRMSTNDQLKKVRDAIDATYSAEENKLKEQVRRRIEREEQQEHERNIERVARVVSSLPTSREAFELMMSTQRGQLGRRVACLALTTISHGH